MSSSSPAGRGADADPEPRTALVRDLGPTLPERSLPTALLPLLGRSPLQRHAVQLARVGVREMIVLLPEEGDDDLPRVIDAQIDTLPEQARAEITVRCAPEASRAELEEEITGVYLEVTAHGIYDPRLYRRLADTPGPVRLVDRGDPSGPVGPIGLAREDGGGDFTEIEVGSLPAYLPSLRRHLRPAWCRITSPAEGRRAEWILLDATQKGVLDFPARYLHPAPENVLTRLFAATPITPNQITVATGFVGVFAAWLMATGRYAPALAIALVVNVLDGVDGKLARVKLLASRFGDRLDHILDVVFEFSWYLGLGWGLSGGGPGPPFVIAVTLIFVMLGTRAMSGIYTLVSGRQIHDHRRFDRAFRLVAGRRNIYVLLFVAGLVVGRLGAAFEAALAWGITTLVVYTVRTAVEAWRGRTGGASGAAAG
ncbi:MAG: CDP-alcohol phosphatidyltransferase family protein [Longimicrobiales bacterium]|nr:CDP-alcohol phosphatidyltransferase family protein [Longimicrobiales bacterium]